MDYQETPPPQSLSGLVRCVWELRGPAPDVIPAPTDPAFPDGSPELIVIRGDPFEYVPPRGRTRRQPGAFLVGQITAPFAVRPTGRIDIVAIRFEAHGASVLHQPMHEITDTWRSLDRASAPVASLVKAMRDAGGRTGNERWARVWEALTHLKERAAEPDARVAQAVRVIRSSGGTGSLDELVGTLGVTLRSLQRLFARDVGISPKRLAQLVRFQRVFAAARYSPRALTRVAHQCGYYDQAHLVRDFRQFAGDAPTRLLTSLPQFTAFFTP